jgi:hypothetical protein
VSTTDVVSPAVAIEWWPLRPDGIEWWTTTPYRVRADPPEHPHESVLQAAVRHGLAADVVHSTSWRVENGSVVLTYVVVTTSSLGTDAVLIHTDHDHPDGTAADHVLRMGDAVGPPRPITSDAVVHHAIHHLALLASTDPAVAAVLSPQARLSLRRLVPAGAGYVGDRSRATEDAHPSSNPVRTLTALMPIASIA